MNILTLWTPIVFWSASFCIKTQQNGSWIKMAQLIDQDDVNDVIKHRFDLFDAKRWRIASQVAERASAKDVLQLLQLEGAHGAYGAHGAHGPVPGHGSQTWNIHGTSIDPHRYIDKCRCNLDVMIYIIIQIIFILCYIVLYYIILYYIMLYYIICYLYFTILYYTVLYCTILYYTNTILYYILQPNYSHIYSHRSWYDHDVCHISSWHAAAFGDKAPRAGRKDLSPMATMATLLNGMVVLFMGHAAGHGILTVPHSKNNGYPGWNETETANSEGCRMFWCVCSPLFCRIAWLLLKHINKVSNLLFPGLTVFNHV